MIYICYQPHAATAQGETKEPYDIKLSLGCLLDYSPSISNTHTHRPGHLLAEGGWEGWSLDLPYRQQPVGQIHTGGTGNTGQIPGYLDGYKAGKRPGLNLCA